MRTVCKSCANIVRFICNSLLIRPLKTLSTVMESPKYAFTSAKKFTNNCVRISQDLCVNMRIICIKCINLNRQNILRAGQHWIHVRWLMPKALTDFCTHQLKENAWHTYELLYCECTQMTKLGICSNSTKLLTDWHWLHQIAKVSSIKRGLYRGEYISLRFSVIAPAMPGIAKSIAGPLIDWLICSLIYLVCSLASWSGLYYL